MNTTREGENLLISSGLHERQSRILAELELRGMVKVAQLTQIVGVSTATLRRDLAYLENLGLLKRVHGGVRAVTKPEPGTWFSEHLPRQAEEKNRIGAAAAQLIKPWDSVIVDGGTSVYYMIRNLPEELLETGHLTFVTNSMRLVQELGRHRGVHLIILGGVYLPSLEFSVGPQTLQAIAQLHVNKIVLGCDGLSIARGATVTNVLEAEVDRAMVAAADEVILLADSSKLGVAGLATVLPIERLDKLVTDSGAPAALLDEFRALSVEVIVV